MLNWEGECWGNVFLMDHWAKGHVRQQGEEMEGGVKNAKSLRDGPLDSKQRMECSLENLSRVIANFIKSKIINNK